MQITEAIILAGGEGTRLQQAVPGLPKCLAPINGRAFIDYLLLHLQAQGITRYVFALGVKAWQVQSYLEQNWPQIHKAYAIETTPLGTGGAIKNAVAHTITRQVLVLNGDTLFRFNLPVAATFHQASSSKCTLLVKPMQAVDRYGSVTINDAGRVTGFGEKSATGSGYINAGVYLLNMPAFTSHLWPAAFSFETDYLQQLYKITPMFAFVQDGYFIDIGLPEDYLKAQSELND